MVSNPSLLALSISREETRGVAQTVVRYKSIPTNVLIRGEGRYFPVIVISDIRNIESAERRISAAKHSGRNEDAGRVRPVRSKNTVSLHSISLPHLPQPFLPRGQGGHALNYQLPTALPRKSNRNYEPVTRPTRRQQRGLHRRSLPPSLLPSRPPSLHSEIYFVRARG